MMLLIWWTGIACCVNKCQEESIRLTQI